MTIMMIQFGCGDWMMFRDLSGNLIANISASTFTGVQTGATMWVYSNALLWLATAITMMSFSLLDGNVIRSFPEDTFESIGGLYDLWV